MSTWPLPADGLPDVIKTARSAVEECFTALDSAEPQPDADTRAEICQLLDEASINLNDALKLVQAES